MQHQTEDQDDNDLNSSGAESDVGLTGQGGGEGGGAGSAHGGDEGGGDLESKRKRRLELNRKVRYSIT